MVDETRRAVTVEWIVVELTTEEIRPRCWARPSTVGKSAVVTWSLAVRLRTSSRSAVSLIVIASSAVRMNVRVALTESEVVTASEAARSLPVEADTESDTDTASDAVR
jgi:hypothetical protein